MTFCKTLITLPLLFLYGCSSVQTKNEWQQVKCYSRVDTELIWIESSCDEEKVRQLTQETLAHPLSQNDAVSIGLLNNHNLQSSFEDIGISKADLVQAGLFKNPNLSALFKFPLSGTGINIESEGLFNISEFWQLPLRKQSTQAALDATLLSVAHEVIKTKHDIQVAYNNAFFLILKAKESLSYYSQSQALSTEAKRRHEFGYFTEVDVYQAEIFENAASIMLKDYESMIVIETSELMRNLGIHDDFKLDESFKMSDFPSFSFEEMLSFACQNRLDLQAAQLKVSEQERMLALNRRRLFKDVNAGLAHEKESEGHNFLGPSIDFEVPIFDQNQAQIAKSQYMLRKAQKELLALEDKIRLEISSSLAKIDQYQHSSKVYESKILPLQHNIINFDEYWSTNMQINRFTLLEAQKELFSLKIAFFDSQQNLYNALAELEYHLGGILPGDEDT